MSSDGCWKCRHLETNSARCLQCFNHYFCEPISKPKNHRCAPSISSALLTACKELKKAHGLMNTGELIESVGEYRERENGLRNAVLNVIKTADEYGS